ncbi:hypothetical protein V6N13_098779 [Hibiscus sabdariffa]
MKLVPKHRHEAEAEVSCDAPNDSINVVDAGVAAKTPSNVSQNHPKPPKQSRGKCIEKHLLEWGIDKVLTITVDNTSSNDVAIKLGEQDSKYRDELHSAKMKGLPTDLD